MNLIERLKIDNWYEGLFYLGGFTFGLSLVYPLHGITNTEGVFIGLGMFLFGIGRMKNNKSFTGIQDMGFRGMLKLSGERRKVDPIGMLLELTGVSMMILSLLSVTGIYVL